MFNCDASFNLQLHQLVHITLFACLMVLSATFNNISVTSLSSDLLVEKIGVSGENYRPVASHSQTLSHSVVLSTHRHERGSNILPEKLQRNYTLSTCLFLVFNRRKVQYSHLVENRHIIFEKDSIPFKAITISVLFMMQSNVHAS